MGILLRNPNTSEKQGTDPKKNAAINHPLIDCGVLFGSSVPAAGGSERHRLELAARLVLVDRALNAVSIVDVPALEFVQQRFVANVQTPRRLFAIPARL